MSNAETPLKQVNSNMQIFIGALRQFMEQFAMLEAAMHVIHTKMFEARKRKITSPSIKNKTKRTPLWCVKQKMKGKK